jgi:hypothetical protein
MPDIAMCKNDTCPLKNTCYRFKATPSEFYQSYGLFEYDLEKGKVNVEDGCNYYWKIENINNKNVNTRNNR